jgi:hypothetical protein
MALAVAVNARSSMRQFGDPAVPAGAPYSRNVTAVSTPPDTLNPDKVTDAHVELFETVVDAMLARKLSALEYSARAVGPEPALREPKPKLVAVREYPAAGVSVNAK